MSTYEVLSLTITVITYFFLGHHLLSGKAEQNFATWSLWVVLDAIAAGSLYIQHGNYTLPFLYVFGGTSIAICIAKSHKPKWTLYETFISGLVGLCMIGWWISGPWLATIFSTLAVAVATIPLFGDVWREPKETPTMVYTGFAVADVFSIMAGRSWTVEERFYPIVALGLCITIVVLSLTGRPRPAESPSV